MKKKNCIAKSQVLSEYSSFISASFFENVNFFVFPDVYMIVTAQAGTKLKKIQNESSKKGLIFPVNIAPNEKCTIGGNVSTNVGGLLTLKYGNIEEYPMHE